MSNVTQEYEEKKTQTKTVHSLLEEEAGGTEAPGHPQLREKT